MAEDVADAASYAARGRGLRFVTKIPDDPVFVRAKVQRISQVLANIGSNAMKYSSCKELSDVVTWNLQRGTSAPGFSEVLPSTCIHGGHGGDRGVLDRGDR